MSGLPFWKSAEIGLFRPFSAFFALFRKARRAPGKSRISEEKGLFPQISSDLLKPPSLKPPFTAPQNGPANSQHVGHKLKDRSLKGSFVKCMAGLMAVPF